mmetsp:Transcript_49906/g.98601  ORF Transcript_49906/g.98601 Transcript_49906/m.98601 type:complete len:401 (-) Transcript_49906:214-1416(-)
MAVTVVISTDGLPTWIFVLTYFGVGPSLTLGFKFLFGSNGLGFHFPLATVWCLLYLEWLLAAFVRRQSNVSDDEGLDELVALPVQAARCASGITVKRLGWLVGICLATEIACSNLSLLSLSVSFHTMMKASTPAYVLLFAALLGLERLTARMTGVVCVIVTGVALCSFGEIDFALSGFVFINVAAAAGGLRWAATHLYLGQTPTASSVGGVLELLVRSLPAALIFLPPLVLAFELRPLISHIAAAPSSVMLLIRLGLLLFVFAIGGFVMILVEMTLVHRLSSLTFSVMSIAKELLVVLLSVAVYSDELTLLNWGGFALTLAGILAFRRLRESHSEDTQQNSLYSEVGSREGGSPEESPFASVPSDRGGTPSGPALDGDGESGEVSSLISHYRKGQFTQLH